MVISEYIGLNLPFLFAHSYKSNIGYDIGKKLTFRIRSIR